MIIMIFVCIVENFVNERATSTTASIFGSLRVCVRNLVCSEMMIDFRFYN